MLKVLASLLVLISPSWSMELLKEGSLKVDVEHITNQKNINKLYEDVEKLIKEHHINPEKISVVLDVNRTLYIKSREVPRAVERVKDLAKLGVLLVISSANKRFEYTVNRLAEAGLSGSLNLPFPLPEHFSPEIIEFNGKIKLNAYHTGKIASTQTIPVTIKKFSHKAFSVFAVYGEKARHVEYAFFADDSKVNRDLFVQHTMNDYALGTKLKQLKIYEMNVD
jgi:hypothetical protein